MNASIHILRLCHHLLMSFVCKIPISLLCFAIWHSHMMSMAKMGISDDVCVCTATMPDSGLVNAFESQPIWYTINASYTGYKNSTLYIYLYLLPESCPNAGF